jgi:hypothetical protein
MVPRTSLSIIVEKSANEARRDRSIPVARDIVIQNPGRESKLPCDIRSALGRVDECAFGTVLALRGGDQPATPGGGALGAIVPEMSGGRRPSGSPMERNFRVDAFPLRNFP